MIEDKILTADFKLESIEEVEGRFFFTAKSLSKDFECDKGREMLSKESKNKPLIWRHQHPIQEGNQMTHVYGYVNDSWLEDGEIFSKYELYDHTKEHLAIRKIIEKKLEIGDPLGISMRYRKYYIGDKILHFDVFEHSGTPFPACESCKTKNFGVKNMVNEGEQKPDEKISEEELSEKLKLIEGLQTQLDSKTKILEEYQVKLEKFEKTIKSKDEKLEKAEESEKSLEDKIFELEKSVDFLKKKPLIDQILEIKKFDDRMLEFLKTQDEDYLKEKLEEAKKESETKIITKTQEDSAKEAKEKADEELSKKEPTMEEFTKLLNLRKKEKDKK